MNIGKRIALIRRIALADAATRKARPGFAAKLPTFKSLPGKMVRDLAREYGLQTKRTHSNANRNKRNRRRQEIERLNRAEILRNVDQLQNGQGVPSCCAPPWLASRRIPPDARLATD